MAKFQHSFSPSLFYLLGFLCMATTIAVCEAQGRKVGGRTPVKNVEDNREIQELGRYCVHQYNIQQEAVISNASSKVHHLVFFRVVAAETQVVSGIKYFLKISAAPHQAATKDTTFEAVVVVKPWLHSKELLTFSPSTSFTS